VDSLQEHFKCTYSKEWIDNSHIFFTVCCFISTTENNVVLLITHTTIIFKIGTGGHTFAIKNKILFIHGLKLILKNIKYPI